jgi:hypothetical protein
VRVTIDLYDGAGPVDYRPLIAASHPLKLVGKLNEPSRCSFGVACTSTGLQQSQNARVSVADDDGSFYFTGYMTTEPVLEYCGAGIEGPAYIAIVSAVSDEIQLDKQALPTSNGRIGQPVSVLMTALAANGSTTMFDTSDVISQETVGHFAPNLSEPWSKNAGDLAALARAGYRVLDGKLSLTPIGTVVHQCSEEDGTLSLASLTVSRSKMLVNDVTLCGEEEPATYATEFFLGDGITSAFDLSGHPFSATGSNAMVIEDGFIGPAIDPRTWQIADPGFHFSLSAAGLTISGGSGFEGQTNLIAQSAVEIGGGLLVEATGMMLAAFSDGLLLGLCDGAVLESNYFAGFRVKQAAGNVSIVPIAGGAENGVTFAVNPGSLYTLRLRVYCAEHQRVQESFYSVGDDGLKMFGGSLNAGSASLLMEIQETINGIPAPAVVLYDGSIGQAPAVCSLVLVDSSNISGSVKSVRVTTPTAAWVETCPAGGGWATRRLGASAADGDCIVETSGRVRFYPTAIPSNGERISVRYRTGKRAIARVTQQGATGDGGDVASCLTGTLSEPTARSSNDCENGARALLNASCSRSSAMAGKYAMNVLEGAIERGEDVWPGDALAITSPSSALDAQVVVREVLVEMLSVSPQVLQYKIDFANDWAQELSLKVSSAVPSDAWLPAPTDSAVIEDLAPLTVSVNGASIAVDAGVTPPLNGGFEVRRRDWAFGPGANSDLVLRSPVQHFSIPRWAACEQYYVRMYDGSTPPVYSRFSSGIFLNLPM